ncbi:MAG TPA: prolipoprotein diacylglyceryl transferase [Candidatus Limnocylindrales bacterium]|nr:prolipoprotein diacylglyceryl transferase [Candidatus Limnocylindrales bacterium]
MLPFIHIGPITLGTYGIFVAIGLLVGFFVVQSDLHRRGLSADPNAIVGFTGLAGLACSRLYHLLETPHEFFANPWPLLFSTMGFAWFGAAIGGLVALLLIARHYKMSALLMLDIASPAAAIGYGFGRVGCLISGDGDYGTPTSLPWGMSFPNGLVPTTDRVHPTPIYEFLAAVLIFWILWKLGARWMRNPRTVGNIFAVYLLLSGVARFLVEFIRLNPRSFFGMTNAQTASLAGILLGVVILLRTRASTA